MRSTEHSPIAQSAGGDQIGELRAVQQKCLSPETKVDLAVGALAESVSRFCGVLARAAQPDPSPHQGLQTIDSPLSVRVRVFDEHGAKLPPLSQLAQVIERELAPFQTSSPMNTALEKRTDLAAQVCEAMLGAGSSQRRGWSPSSGNLRSIEDVVRAAMDVETPGPISMMVGWGALKNYGLIPWSRGVSMPDVLALAHMAAAHRRVEAVYAPGLHTTIYLENLTEEMIAGSSPELCSRMNDYRKQLEAMTAVLAPERFQIMTEEDALRQCRINDDACVRLDLNGVQNLSRKDFFAVAQRSYDLIRSYWYASSASNIVPATAASESYAYQELPSYRRLAESGWVGSIPQDQRDSLVARLGKEIPGASLEQREDRAIRYLAAAFARKSLGVLEGVRRISGRGFPLIKFSFEPLPPGTPESLERRRVEYDMGGRPWCSVGGLIKDEKGTTAGVVEYSRLDEMRHEANFEVAFVRGGRTFTCQAQIYERRRKGLKE